MKGTWAASWRGAGNVLAIRLDSLGDVLMTSPALRALKAGRQGRRLTLLTSPAGAVAGRAIADVDEVLVYEAPWIKATPLRADAAHDRETIDALRARRFDGAVVFTVYSQNPLPAALLAYLADIPRRLAFCRENPYQLLTHHADETEPQGGIRHEVRRQLDLVAAIGCSVADERLSIRVPDAARARVAAMLASLGVDARRAVVVHPGASAPSRRYPPESYAEVARRLVLELGRQVVFTGEASEAPLVEEIRTALRAPSHSLAGRLSLEELGALLASVGLLVSNNTGPVHVAAAVGTAVVDLYALTNPQHTPWKVPHRVLSHDVPCRFCYRSVCPEGHNDCLRRISPNAVVSAAREMLEASALPVASR
jgi:lipopolysaccharide heptosyltransferase II